MPFLQVSGLQVAPEKFSGNTVLVVDGLALSQVCGSRGSAQVVSHKGKFR
jgi:hypothetical protein